MPLQHGRTWAAAAASPLAQHASATELALVDLLEEHFDKR